METRRKEVVARRASEAETKREMLSPSLSLVDAFPQASHWSSSSHLVTQRGKMDNRAEGSQLQSLCS